MPIPKLDAGAQKYNQKPGFSQLCHIHSPEQMIFDLFLSDQYLDLVLGGSFASLVTASWSVSPPGSVPSTSVVKETATGTPIFLAALTTPIASSE